MSCKGFNAGYGNHMVMFDEMPIEIMTIIFRYLNLNSFLTCRIVCKKWKAVIDSIKDDNIWTHFLEEEFSPKYLSFIRKSILPVYKIFQNIAAWNMRTKVETEWMECNQVVYNIHVYKDNLIVVTAESVEYHNADDLRQIKRLERPCIDFNESDYMQAEITPRSSLHLYGKTDSTSFLTNQIEERIEHRNILLYRLEDERCYFISNKTNIWMCKWSDNKWSQKFLAKYHGCDDIRDMNVWGDEVYLVSRYGRAFRVVEEERRLEVVDTATGALGDNDSGPYIFDKCSLVLSPPLVQEPELYVEGESLVLNHKYASCVLQHGDVVLIGQRCGKVDIVSLHTMKTMQTYNPLVMMALHQDMAIHAIDVYESENSHNLFMLTYFGILKYVFKF